MIKEQENFWDTLRIFIFEEKGCSNSRVDSVAAENLPRRSHS